MKCGERNHPWPYLGTRSRLLPRSDQTGPYWFTCRDPFFGLFQNNRLIQNTIVSKILFVDRDFLQIKSAKVLTNQCCAPPCAVTVRCTSLKLNPCSWKRLPYYPSTRPQLYNTVPPNNQRDNGVSQSSEGRCIRPGVGSLFSSSFSEK